MQLPYLAGVVTANDVRQKGTGSYAADFVSWAKIMQLINKHAPGWMPQLAVTPEGDNVFKAPDGTGYVQVSFVHPDEGETTEWCQAVMNNRNQPVAYGSISARDVTDTHRRAICSAAAAFFSLGYELWAREEYAEAEQLPADADAPVKAASEPKKPATKKEAPRAQPKPATSSPEVKAELQGQLIDLIQIKMTKDEIRAYLDEKEKLWKLNGGPTRVQSMNVDQLQICIDELKSRKPY
jgi:hypothetical protein